MVHLDVFGPMDEATHASKRYIVIFTDNYSKKCIYCLKQKLEIAATFQKFKAFAESQPQTKIKALRMDNDKEYISCAL